MRAAATRILEGANVPWRVRRLMMMSAPEIAQRLQTHARLMVWQRRTTWSPPRFVARPAPSSYRLPADGATRESEAAIREADGILAGRLVALGQTFVLDDVNWSLDPQSGRIAPLRFGPQLDYRDRELVGNARNIWELNRHQHLTLVALAYALSGDERYARFVRRQLDTWLDQNPFPMGINWASPLELGLRLISWVWISRLLAGSPQRDALFGECGRIWPVVYWHQRMLAALRSVGSSANNHLIGEMAGLFTSAVEWPWFAESQAWIRMAQRSLETESERQYYPSGVNREQAFGYHVFATELLLAAAIDGERASRPFSRDFHHRLLTAVQAAVVQLGPDGRQPTYGDCDEGMATGLPCGGRRAVERLAATVAALERAGDIGLSLSGEALFAARLQLSGLRAMESVPPVAGRPQHAAAGSRAFRDAGLFVMRSASRDEPVMVVADAGDLGYLSIAAHGHADALSFTLAVGDEQFIIDPGTFAYHFDPEARAYFRGTLAHNTICIDGLDQSQAGGPFLWTSRARATVHDWRETSDGAVLDASHDGYERLARPLTHRRVLTLQGETLLVDDELAGEGEHDIEWRLHLAPECEAALHEATCDVRGKRHGLSMQLDSALRWHCMVGQSQGGWSSSAFNQREKTTTIAGVARLSLPVRLRHVLRVSR